MPREQQVRSGGTRSSLWALCLLACACNNPNGQGPSQTPNPLLPFTLPGEGKDPLEMGGNGAGPGLEPPGAAPDIDNGDAVEQPSSGAATGGMEAVAGTSAAGTGAGSFSWPGGTGATSGTGGQGADPEPPPQEGGGASTPREPTECLIATPLDSCCMPAIAASDAEVAESECLVPYDRNGRYPQDLLDRCQQPLGDSCATVRCAAPTPTARRVDFDESGECSFVDECTSDDDCVLATDFESICPCLKSWPAELVQAEKCIGPLGSTAPSDCESNSPIYVITCFCALPTPAACVQEAGLQVCR